MNSAIMFQSRIRPTTRHLQKEQNEKKTFLFFSFPLNRQNSTFSHSQLTGAKTSEWLITGPACKVSFSKPFWIIRRHQRNRFEFIDQGGKEESKKKNVFAKPKNRLWSVVHRYGSQPSTPNSFQCQPLAHATRLGFCVWHVHNNNTTTSARTFLVAKTCAEAAGDSA